jgi:cytochrome c-type biogenesis protein CcmH
LADRPQAAGKVTVLTLLFVVLVVAFAGAVEPGERLADPALEARAREISRGLRCLVCQNQSIDDSDAELARDLRVLVRERLTAGDGDDEVVAYIVSRYGDFVLLEPPFQPNTYALWFGPPLVLAAGIAGYVVFYRRRRTATGNQNRTLTKAEQERLRTLLADDER